MLIPDYPDRFRVAGIGDVSFMSRAEMNRWAEEDLLPRVERAVNQRFAGRGT